MDVSVERLAGVVQFDVPRVHAICLIMEARRKSGRLTLSGRHDQSIWLPRKRPARANSFRPFRPFLRSFAHGGKKKER